MQDSTGYLQFTGKMNLDKAIHTLEGILKGIAIDSKISESEVQKLRRWLELHAELAHKHPFNEIMPLVKTALEDGMISEDEHKDILWVCGNLHTDSIYYDSVTSDIQRLHGIIHGLLADGIVNDDEIKRLADWVAENEHLKRSYPFDEVDSLLSSILSDGKIDDHERTELQEFLKGFLPNDNRRTSQSESRKLSVPGICAVCPSIFFASKTFCLTGESKKASRDEMIKKVVSASGKVIQGIRRDLDYLIVGAAGNPCWAFSCYGRKVEKAVEYRKQGNLIVIVHENDFWDALADAGYL